MKGRMPYKASVGGLAEAQEGVTRSETQDA
jgi:hypothetical protein